MAEIKAPNEYPRDKPIVFLGGVIDQGKADNWQKTVAEALSDLDVTILNPRRDDWDDSWEQSADNPEFVEQVTWELQGQELASVNIYVFGADEKAAKEAEAPITLMELGLHANADHTIVCCPQGYYRKGNVDVTCAYYDIPVYEELDPLIQDVRTLLEEGV
jgi:hypothetical protein